MTGVKAPIGFPQWLSTADAAREIGVSDWWIRERIESGLLRANVISTGKRRIYRIAVADWTRFKTHYVRLAVDPSLERRDP